jgi:PAS domain S-box-containing protein
LTHPDPTPPQTGRTPLAHAQEQFHFLFESAPDAVIVSDAEGRVVFANRQAEVSFGYDRDAMIGLPVEDLLPERSRASHVGHRSAYHDAPGEHIMSNGRFVARRKDGSEFFFEVSLSRLRGDAGVLVISVIRDVTAREQADERLRFQARLLDVVAQALVATDGAGRVAYWNRFAEALYGKTRDEAIGQPILAALPFDVPPDQQQEIVDALRAGNSWAGETAFTLPDRGDLFVTSVISPIQDGNGNTAGFVAATSDITERRRLEKQLQQAHRLESIGRLAGGVAHDFNNLMTAVIGLAEIGGRDLPADHPARADFREIRETAERAAALTQQLLAFSRRQFVQPRIVDLNDVVARTDAVIRRLTGADVDVSARLSPDLWRVRADPEQVERVLLNLALNARDAMPAGGKLLIETANISLDDAYAAARPAVQPGDYVMMAVTDTGTGMTAGVMAHIFEPFFTTKGFRSGTGLGLSTCFGIVKQAGGHIWAYSEPGCGSSFKVYLPRVRVASDLPCARPLPADLPRGTETVLVADDEPGVRRVIARLLRQLGYQVLEAADGEAAAAIAHAYGSNIHLVITDVVMPGMGGRELAQAVRRINPRARTIFMSGFTANAVIEHAAVDPGCAFLPKPFSPALLAHTVRETLDAQPA